MEKKVIFETKDISKAFGPTKAVCDVSLQLYEGEIRCLIGENGSGKSTFTSMVAGYQRSDSGTMTFNGAAYLPENPMAAGRQGISMILQEKGTIEGLTVAENMFLGNEAEFVRFGVRNKKRMNARAKELLTQYGMDYIKPDEDISHYKFEERKLIEIAKAMYLNPRILIIDETTTALSMKGRDMLYALIKEIKAKGGTVIFISHDFQEILSLSDTITIFRDGHHIGTLDNDEHITEDKLKMLMVGRELSGKYYREDYDGCVSSEVVLQVEKVNLEGTLRDISFNLHKGEILGIGGLSESGMHELGKIVCGANQADSGKVMLTEKGVEIKNIRQAIEGGVGYVSKNRDEEALILYSSISDNICISSMDLLKKGVYINCNSEKQFGQCAAENMQVKMASVTQYVSALSGGNKQKVALAKWIARDSDILVLDCPTRGIDVMVKATIYSLMSELKAQGKSIILISEELLELIGMSDRILLLKDGELTGELGRSKDLSEHDVIHYMV